MKQTKTELILEGFSDQNKSEITEIIEIESPSGVEMEFFVNGKYFMDALNAIKSIDVNISFQNNKM